MDKNIGKITAEELVARAELAFEWVAQYNDGTELKQYDDIKQLAYHFGHINQDKINKFILVPKKSSLFPIAINLVTGMFELDNKVFPYLYQGENKIPVGFDLTGKTVSSSWGNKTKLIYVRHVRRDFVPGSNGFQMQASSIYEIGWEAMVNNEHMKFTLAVDEEGHLSIPQTQEQQGFKSL